MKWANLYMWQRIKGIKAYINILKRNKEMPKKIATENINAKLGIVMKSGKALLGIILFKINHL